MTALDQAFIKAYMRHSGVPTPAMAEQARPVLPTPVPPECPTSSCATPDEACEPAAVEPRADPTPEEPERSGSAGTCCQTATRRSGRPGPSVEDLDIPAGVGCFGPELPTDAPPPAGAEPAASPQVDAGPQDGLPEAAPTTGPEGFCPALQTDRFGWPDVCRELDAVGESHLDRLADALEAGIGQGSQVVGLGGLRRGEGCTTLLLCAARRLARRGLSVLIVDAHVDDPQLDRRLGLAPGAGWQDVVAGRVPLDEAVIESVEDRLAVLPLCARGDERRAAPDRASLADAGLATLRRSYDLVLVDLGPARAAAGGGCLPAQAAAGAIDAVVLVCDIRSTSLDKLAELQAQLAAAGIAQAGLVENFVPAGQTTEHPSRTQVA